MLYAIETSEFLGWLDKRPSQGSAARQNRKNLVFNKITIHQTSRDVHVLPLRLFRAPSLRYCAAMELISLSSRSAADPV